MKEVKTKKKMIDNSLVGSERELAIRNRIADAFLTLPDKKLFGEVLAIVLEVLESKHGVFGYIDLDGALVCPSMTRDVWGKCQVPDKDIRFSRDSWGDSIWGQAIRQKKVLCSNKPFSVPEGHIPMKRALAVPIVFQKKAIGLLLVANKKKDYDDSDKKLLKVIADHIAPILGVRLLRERQVDQRILAEEAVKKIAHFQIGRAHV